MSFSDKDIEALKYLVLRERNLTGCFGEGLYFRQS